MEKNNLQSICTYLIEIVKEANHIILAARLTPFTISTKNSRLCDAISYFLCSANGNIAVDIVTQTDKAVESFIRDRLEQRYPTFAVIGEETFKTAVAMTDHPTFIVDPIDGTSNFVHNFPAVCISIGLVIGMEQTVGVVYNPFYSELWSAVKGQGAFTFLPNRGTKRLPLSSSPLQGLGPACIGIEWGSDCEVPILNST